MSSLQTFENTRMRRVEQKGEENKTNHFHAHRKCVSVNR